MLDRTTTKRLLGGARLAVGLAGWLAPRTTARGFGLAHAERGLYVTRLFGSRDLVLGAGLLSATGSREQTAVEAGIVIDTLDVVSGLDELRRGRIGPWALVSAVGGAVLFAGLGLALRQTPAGSAEAGMAPAGR